MTAYIAYDNVFKKSGTFASSNEIAGGEKENGIDWLLYDAWKPGVNGASSLSIELDNPQPCNYVAIAGHNLADSANTRVAAQYSTDGNTWVDMVAELPILPDNQTIMLVVADTPAVAHWRLYITNGISTNFISHVCIGYANGHSIMPPFTPPPEKNAGKPRHNLSVTGLYLGSDYDLAPFDVKFNVKFLAPAQMRAEFAPILDHISQSPFFFQWDNERWPDEAAFCWLKKPPKNYRYDSTMHMTQSIQAVGVR